MRKISASEWPHLYKYGSVIQPRLDWLKKILSEHRIYVPLAKELNDPLDARPVLKRIPMEGYIKFLQQYRDHPIVREPLTTTSLYAFGPERVRRQVTDSLHRDVARIPVYSLTRRADNFLMWAHYADNYRGYCLEFRTAGVFSEAREVQYVENYELDMNDPSAASAEWMFRKTPLWSYEEEARITGPAAPAGNRLHFVFPPELLTRLILGEAMPSSASLEIRKLAKHREPRLPVWVAR